MSHRSSFPLSPRLEAKLLHYTVAASAAGVSALALAKPAVAKIIYTPANIRINHNTTLDLNHDGITDFSFSGFHSSHVGAGVRKNTYFNSQNGGLSILGAGSLNQILGSSKNFYPAALSAGAQIGSSGKFPAPKEILRAHDINSSTFFNFGYGPWGGSKGLGVQDRYLGAKFVINGQTHFGWIRVNLRVQLGGVIQAKITGYAYEDLADTPIQAGKTKGTAKVAEAGSQPVTLGRLAAGAPALQLWRKQERSI